MGLRDNLSRLSPNEFLEKMQDMFQMYQENYKDNLKKLNTTTASSPRNAQVKSFELKRYKEPLKKLGELIDRIVAVTNESNSRRSSEVENDIAKKLSRIKMAKIVENPDIQPDTLLFELVRIAETMKKYSGI